MMTTDETTDDHIKEEELAGAWKCLCASVLSHAVRKCLSSPSKRNWKQGNHTKPQGVTRAMANEWIENGDTGEITFTDCMMALGLDEGAFKESIEKARRDPLLWQRLEQFSRGAVGRGRCIR